MTDVIDVFVDGDMTIHMQAPGKLNEKKLTKLLKSLDVTIESKKRDNKNVL